MNAPIGVVRYDSMATNFGDDDAELPNAFDDSPAFVAAAARYICQDRPEDEWSDAQRQAMQIIETLDYMFRGCEKIELLPGLARAAAELDGIRTIREKRIEAMNLIAVVSPSVQLSQMVAYEPQRVQQSHQLAHQLAFHLAEVDLAFAPLKDDLADLVVKLLAFAPSSSGRKGRKNAARILAELIVDANGALGILVKSDEEDEIERVRQSLQRDYLSLKIGKKPA